MFPAVPSCSRVYYVSGGCTRAVRQTPRATRGAAELASVHDDQAPRVHRIVPDVGSGHATPAGRVARSPVDRGTNSLPISFDPALFLRMGDRRGTLQSRPDA